LRRLSADAELRATIAARGHRVYAERASRTVLGAAWVRALTDSALA
jgi:hypothetical protein